MAKRNYKVYAEVGAQAQHIKRALFVLDTGAGPNFVRKSELPEQTVIRQGPHIEICDANGRPLKICGWATLNIRLGHYHARVEFVVCERLAAPFVLGTDFCDRFVEAIRQRTRQVELNDGMLISIVRKPLPIRGSLPVPKAQRKIG